MSLEKLSEKGSEQGLDRKFYYRKGKNGADLSGLASCRGPGLVPPRLFGQFLEGIFSETA